MVSLTTWLDSQPRGTRRRLKKAAAIGHTTLWRAENGHRVSYPVALRISLATGGAVPIAVLCDPPSDGSPVKRDQSKKDHSVSVASDRHG